MEFQKNTDSLFDFMILLQAPLSWIVFYYYG